MAIILRKNKNKTYLSSSGVITNSDKRIADKLDRELSRTLKNLENDWLKRGLLTKSGVKKEALRIWYELGNVLNKLIDKYNIRGTSDEPFFWRSVYDHVSTLVQKKPPPKRSDEWRRNHFRLCALMAQRTWSEVQQVGPWSVWRDLFDNLKLLEDRRVLDWVVKKIGELNLGHKELRPFIHSARRRLIKIDTGVLNDDELKKKLDDIEF